MSFSHGKNCDIYIVDSGGTERDFTGYCKEVSTPFKSDPAEVTTLGKDDKVYIGGLKDKTVSLSGPWDATVDNYMFNLLATSSRVKVFPEGSVTGKIYYLGTAVWNSYEPASSVDSASEFKFEGQGTDAWTRGTA